MNCSICNLPTGNIVGSVLPQCKCGWQAPNPPATQRPWIGLTDDEYEKLAEKYVTNCYFDTLKYAKAMEQLLKNKNT